MSRDLDGGLQRQVEVLFEAGTLGGRADGALLDRFASGRDHASEAAFACLVERHGPMVLRVCRATLGDEHEAHDAFQATFLVLARKARSVRVRDTIGPWLHGVAWRVSARARAAGLRRRRHERRAAEMASRSFEEPARDGKDAEAALHEEVRRLPEAFRAAVVLCDLEGLTTDGAAERLGVPVGTVRSRLYRGRDRLRGRLLRRGIAPAAVGAALTPAAVSAIPIPAALAEATVRLAVGCFWVGTVPARLAVLMHGGRHVMGIKSLAAMGLSLGLVAGVGGLAAQGPGDGPPRAGERTTTDDPSKTKRTVEMPKVESKPAVLTTTDLPSGTSDPAVVPGDHERLQGRWTVVRVTEGGKELVNDDMVLGTLRFRGDGLEIHHNRGGGVERARFKIEPDARTPTLLVAFGGKSNAWLYSLNGDWLKLAFAIGEDPPRAKSFDDPGPDPQHPVEILELRRDADPPAPRGPLLGGGRAPAPANAAEPEPVPSTDRERLQGRWTVIGATLNGREDEANSVLLTTLTFRGNEIRFAPRANGQGTGASYSFLIDPDSEPRAMLVAPLNSSPDRPQWWLFAFRGRKLRLAMDETGKAGSRPKGFDAVDAEHPITVLDMIRDDAPERTRDSRELGLDAAASPAAERIALPEPSTPPTTEVDPATPALYGPASVSVPVPLDAPIVSISPAPAPVAVPAAEPPQRPAPVAIPRTEPSELTLPPADDPPATATVARPVDLRLLQGTWSILAQEEDGHETKPDADSTVLIAGNALVMVSTGGRGDAPALIEATTFVLNPSRDPPQIDVTASYSNPVQVQRGIYRLDGNSLLLCVAIGGKPRPTEFDTSPGSGHRLFVLRRKKAPQPAVSSPSPNRGMPVQRPNYQPDRYRVNPSSSNPSPAPDEVLPSFNPAPRSRPAPSSNPSPAPSPAPRPEPSPATTPGPASAPAPAPRSNLPPSANPAGADGDDAPNPAPPTRVSALLDESEQLRRVGDDWDRFWFLDRPGQLAPFRSHDASSP